MAAVIYPLDVHADLRGSVRVLVLAGTGERHGESRREHGASAPGTADARMPFVVDV